MATQGKFFYRPDYKAKSFEDFFKFDRGLAMADDELARASANSASLSSDVAYYISPAGSDTSGDGSLEKPFATVAHIMSITPVNFAGYMVRIFALDGTYTEVVQIQGKINGLIQILSASLDRTKVLWTNGGDLSFGAVISSYNIFLAVALISIRVTSDYGTCLANINGWLNVSLCAFGDDDNVSTSGIAGSFGNILVYDCTDIDSKKVTNGIVLNGNTCVTASGPWQFGETPIFFGSGLLIDDLSFLRTPPASPTVDYQVANKKYVDDKTSNLPIYANNAAALGGGLTAGKLYRTGTDPDHLCVVH